MRRLIPILIIISFVCMVSPTLAGAAITANDTDLITVTAMQDTSGEYLLYRVFAKQGITLPTSVRLALEKGATVADVQESNGVDWWTATYTKSGDTLTVDLTNGRIAEVRVSSSNLFATNEDGTVVATVPLTAQKGFSNVQPGATRPEDKVLILPTNAEMNSDFGSSLLVASTFVDMSRADAPENVTFVFGEPGEVHSDLGVGSAPETVQRETGQCCWWPLVVLSLLFAALLVVYWFVKEREEDELYGLPDDEDEEFGESEEVIAADDEEAISVDGDGVVVADENAELVAEEVAALDEEAEVL